MSITITPPDPRDIARAKKKRKFNFYMALCFASASVIVYIIASAMYCGGGGDFSACMVEPHPVAFLLTAGMATLVYSIIRMAELSD